MKQELTPPELERLAWLAEECSEVVQVAMKIIRHSYESYNPDNVLLGVNRTQLEGEVANVESAIMLMRLRGDIAETCKKIPSSYMHYEENKELI